MSAEQIREIRRVSSEARAALDEYSEIMTHVAVCTNTAHGHKDGVTPGETLALLMVPIVNGYIERLDEEVLVHLDDDELETILASLEPIVETQRIAAANPQRYAQPDPEDTP